MRCSRRRHSSQRDSVGSAAQGGRQWGIEHAHNQTQSVLGRNQLHKLTG